MRTQAPVYTEQEMSGIVPIKEQIGTSYSYPTHGGGVRKVSSLPDAVAFKKEYDSTAHPDASENALNDLAFAAVGGPTGVGMKAAKPLVKGIYQTLMVPVNTAKNLVTRNWSGLITDGVHLASGTGIGWAGQWCTNTGSELATGKTLDQHIADGINSHYGTKVTAGKAAFLNPGWMLGPKLTNTWAHNIRVGGFNQVTPSNYSDYVSLAGNSQVSKWQEIKAGLLEGLINPVYKNELPEKPQWRKRLEKQVNPNKSGAWGIEGLNNSKWLDYREDAWRMGLGFP